MGPGIRDMQDSNGTTTPLNAEIFRLQQNSGQPIYNDINGTRRTFSASGEEFTTKEGRGGLAEGINEDQMYQKQQEQKNQEINSNAHLQSNNANFKSSESDDEVSYLSSQQSEEQEGVSPQRKTGMNKYLDKPVGILTSKTAVSNEQSQ